MEALVGSALWTTAGGTAVGTTGLFGAAGASGTGGIITGALSSLGGGSLLSGLLTGASAFGQLAAGDMSASLMNLQAQQSELSARYETIKGRQQALQIRKELDRNLASQNATFAARGSLAGEGSSAAAAEASKINAAEDIDLATFGAAMGSESERFEAAQYRAKGASAKTAGTVNAIKTVANYRPVASLLEGI